MSYLAVNWLAVVLAMLASMALGFIWYMALSRQWLAATGRTQDQIDPKDFTPFVWSAAGQLVMAYFLAVLTPALMGEVSIGAAVLVGAQMWLAFIATSIVINHRYQGLPWSLSAIDGGYLLGVLVVQGAVIGLFGA